MLDATAGLGLGLGAFLDDVPDFGDGGHDGGLEFGQHTLGFSARICQSARVAITDGRTDGKLRLLGHERQNLSQRQKGCENLVAQLEDWLKVSNQA